MARTLVAAVLGAGAALALAGCSGSTPAPAPSPSAIPLRTVAPCAASVVVPAETVATAPDAGSPPTVIIPVGGAVSFPVPPGARVGLAGDPDATDDAQLCAARTTQAGTVVWVAQTGGYLRVAVQTGIETPARLFLRVTG